MPYSNSPQTASAIANGAIAAFSIVRQDPSNDDKVVQCAANARPLGIGPGYATADGAALPVFVEGSTAQLKLGGGVSAGDRIKSDGSGLGVAIATSTTVAQNSVGIARRAGVSGDVIPVLVAIDTIDPNLTIS